MKVGDDVRVQGAYLADILEIGPIPDSALCKTNHGKPGFLVDWDRYDEDSGEVIHETTGDTSWVLQSQCVLLVPDDFCDDCGTYIPPNGMMCPKCDKVRS